MPFGSQHASYGQNSCASICLVASLENGLIQPYTAQKIRCAA
jgi:hypothetical protein